MSTTVAALIATLIVTGMSSAVSHTLTLVGGAVGCVILACSSLLSRDAKIYPFFIFGTVALAILALVSSEHNTSEFSSTIHILSSYIALVALATSSGSISSFCQQLILGTNVLLTGWILYQGSEINAVQSWQISNPSGAGNLMAAQINMTLPLIFVRIHEAKGVLKIPYILLGGLNTIAVALVMSRNGTGSMLVIFTLYILFNHKRLAAVGVGGILGGAVFLDNIIRLPFVHQILVKMRLVGFVPTAPRSLIWRISWDHISMNPLLGVGPGGPKKILAVLDINHAHNNIVQVALETGLPSAAIFTAMVLLLIAMPIRSAVRSREQFVLTLSVVAYMMYSWTGGPLTFPGATLLLAACVNEARIRSMAGRDQKSSKPVPARNSLQMAGRGIHTTQKGAIRRGT